MSRPHDPYDRAKDVGAVFPDTTRGEALTKTTNVASERQANIRLYCRGGTTEKKVAKALRSAYPQYLPGMEPKNDQKGYKPKGQGAFYQNQEAGQPNETFHNAEKKDKVETEANTFLEEAGGEAASDALEEAMKDPTEGCVYFAEETVKDALLTWSEQQQNQKIAAT